MRWVLGLAALALGAWYVSNRQRRGQPRRTVQDTASPDLQARVRDATTAASNAVQSAAGAATQQAQGVARQAGKAAGDAAATVQQASEGVTDHARQATDAATETAHQAVDTAAQAARQATDAAASATQQTTDAVAGDTAPAPSGGAPSGGARSTVGRTLTTDDSIVPEGERPRPIAGEGTTTAAGGTVNALSPASDGQTATGAAEPLPRGLSAGAPGTGGPAASTIAPTTPDDAESPTTGMETAPVVDRAAEVAERTSGKFVGNKKTRKVHLATSSDLPGESNRVYFESVEEATAAGFTPAPNEDLDEETM